MSCWRGMRWTEREGRLGGGEGGVRGVSGGEKKSVRLQHCPRALGAEHVQPPSADEWDSNVLPGLNIYGAVYITGC